MIGSSVRRRHRLVCQPLFRAGPLFGAVSPVSPSTTVMPFLLIRIVISVLPDIRLSYLCDINHITPPSGSLSSPHCWLHPCPESCGMRGPVRPASAQPQTFGVLPSMLSTRTFSFLLQPRCCITRHRRCEVSKRGLGLCSHIMMIQSTWKIPGQCLQPASKRAVKKKFVRCFVVHDDCMGHRVSIMAHAYRPTPASTCLRGEPTSLPSDSVDLCFQLP